MIESLFYEIFYEMFYEIFYVMFYELLLNQNKKMSNVDATMVSILLKMNALHIMSAMKAFNTQISIAPMDYFSMSIN